MRPESTRRRAAGAAVALLVVVATRVALTVLPWRLVRRASDAAAARTAWLSPQDARRIGARTARMARYVPGASCLTQALAARILLAWHGHASVVRFGVRRGSDGLLAHAWLEHDGHVLVGGPDVDAYEALDAPVATHAR